jgi:hypothetical protein
MTPLRIEPALVAQYPTNWHVMALTVQKEFLGKYKFYFYYIMTAASSSQSTSGHKAQKFRITGTENSSTSQITAPTHDYCANRSVSSHQSEVANLFNVMKLIQKKLKP